LLAAELPADAEGGGSGVGQLPSNAEDP
jgi:hypothetical protein